MKKKFKGKAIYATGGPAAEYGKYGCTLYVGCSNGCTYCYLKKEPFKNACGGDVPTLKKCFKDEGHALEVFEKELMANLHELQKHGLFFTFTSDPCLEETIELNARAWSYCVQMDIPVKILTKKVGFVDALIEYVKTSKVIYKKYMAIGFTLTGHDNLEPGASTNAERIEAIKKLHEAGFKTFASIEPVIDIKSSRQMIKLTKDFRYLYKIGLLSGKIYDRLELRHFVVMASNFTDAKIYFKDILLKQACISRSDLNASCVTRDYDMFNELNNK